MSDPVIEFSDVVKQYDGRRVVDGLSLRIEQGQCFGLLGPNGAGKTTAIRMLLGMTHPESGSIRVLGHAVPDQAHRARAGMGVVPQLDNLDPDFSVRENLSVYASFFGLPDNTLDDRVDWLLEFAELTHKQHARIGELSGGMQRRLTLARALVNDPGLIVLDEPTTGLDPQVRHVMWSRLRELQQSSKTLLLTTHYMEEAERLCDVLAIMDHGRIIAHGSPAELVRVHCERNVFEFPRLDAPQQAALDALPEVRLERSGTSWYAYTEQADPVQDWAAGHPQLRMLHRHHNLEDVFLRLTRRDLRD